MFVNKYNRHSTEAASFYPGFTNPLKVKSLINDVNFLVAACFHTNKRQIPSGTFGTFGDL